MNWIKYLSNVELHDFHILVNNQVLTTTKAHNILQLIIYAEVLIRLFGKSNNDIIHEPKSA